MILHYWKWAALKALLLCLAICQSQCLKNAEMKEELKQCLNSSVVPQRTTWRSSILHNALPGLQLYEVYWSKKPALLPVTMVTQLTYSRIKTLLKLCYGYGGPVSAAVLLPLIEASNGTVGLSPNNLKILAQTAQNISAVHAMTELNGTCQLDIMLMYEVYDNAKTALLYPVNSLRNFARMQVQTKLLCAIDVDMMISSSLSTYLNDSSRVQKLTEWTLQRRAIVLPAIEPSRLGPHGRILADKIQQVDKANLRTMFSKKEARQFKLKVFARGHQPTNYHSFFDKSDIYRVRYKHMYEPWFISHWDVLPMHDSQFKGYGMNKIIFVTSLHLYNFSFWILPSAWIVHRPHGETDVRKMVSRQASDVNKQKVKLSKDSLHRKITELYSAAKHAMLQGKYNPVVDPRVLKCLKELPWLQKLPQLEGHPVSSSVFQ